MTSVRDLVVVVVWRALLAFVARRLQRPVAGLLDAMTTRVRRGSEP
jgi:hypothetical protein